MSSVETSTANSPIDPLSSNSRATSGGLLKTQAYDELKLRILHGKYSPGTFLAERPLAVDLGMSKTPVKAALERLEFEGYITVSPQQGIVVRSLTLDEIADQYEIRIALETFAARTISGKLTDEQVVRLRANLAQQEANESQSHVLDSVRLDAEFHLMPIEFLGNQEIRRVMQQLADKMQRVILRVFQLHPSRAESSFHEHSAIAEAIISGEANLAAQLTEQHLEHGQQLMLAPRRN